MSNEKLSFNDLCKLSGLNIPKPFIEALEEGYTREKCEIILSLCINDSQEVIKPTLINQYINYMLLLNF